ncbi:MAG: hypothetical protein ABSG53_19960 [Thermoguttaceae bacterium]|jgi:hypothetical protein
MALDAYSPCPGGTGKKIKFCCPDLLPELEKIDRMVEGEQFIACIQHIDQFEQKGQYRACLMAIKSELLRVTNQLDRAAAYAADFVERFPQNSAAWSESALLTAVSEGGQAAMGKLQRAVALCDGNIQSRVFEATTVVASALIQEGHWAAGRALLQFLTTLDREDRENMERLIYLNRSAEIPMLLKSDPEMLPCPPDARWRTKFEAAIAPLKKAQWQEAADRLTALAAEATDAPAVWNNLALVRSWLADEEGAREALQKFAALAVPLEDAVESEAIAMLMSESPLGDDVDVVRWTWPVPDPHRLQELLLSDRRVVPVPVDTSAWPVGDSPPPRMAGMLLDRPRRDYDESFSLDNMPSVLGQLLLFGRETDRAARLEIGGLTRIQADQAKTVLRQIGGDSLAPAPEETLMGKTSASHQMISHRWVSPRGAPRAQVDALLVQDFRDTLLNRWPDHPLGVLGGRSLRQAAGDPAAQVKALAVILVMQQWSGRSPAEFDFNDLRSQLGLPTLGPIEPQPDEIRTLPLVRLSRVHLEKLSDDDLVLAFHRANIYHAWDAVRKFARAIIDRPGLARRPERMEAYRAMAQSAATLEDGIACIDEGRRDTLSNGQSCAAWDLMELSFRFGHGDGEQAMRLMQHIESRHIQEQGVAQALTQMLINIGLLNPDGTPVAAPGRRTAAEVGPRASEPSKLWTPDSESAGSGGKLWTPGM